MQKSRSLLIAVPAFALGCLATATLTTTAKASPPQPRTAAQWEYVVTDASSLNVYGSQGYEYCGESAATGVGGFVERKYTMRKQR